LQPKIEAASINYYELAHQQGIIGMWDMMAKSRDTADFFNLLRKNPILMFVWWQ
jgi:hypothetical protein